MDYGENGTIEVSSVSTHDFDQFLTSIGITHPSQLQGKCIKATSDGIWFDIYKPLFRDLPNGEIDGLVFEAIGFFSWQTQPLFENVAAAVMFKDCYGLAAGDYLCPSDGQSNTKVEFQGCSYFL